MDERDEALALRRYFLIRIAVIAVVVWVFSWPIPVLPHTVLWVFFAIVALLVGLTATPRSPASTRGSAPKRTH